MNRETTTLAFGVRGGLGTASGGFCEAESLVRPSGRLRLQRHMVKRGEGQRDSSWNWIHDVWRTKLRTPKDAGLRDGDSLC